MTNRKLKLTASMPDGITILFETHLKTNFIHWFKATKMINAITADELYIVNNQKVIFYIHLSLKSDDYMEINPGTEILTAEEKDESSNFTGCFVNNGNFNVFEIT